MAEINLSQDEAEALMAMEKCAVDEKDWLFPVPGGRIAIPLTSVDKRESFMLDVTRGQIKLTKVDLTELKTQLETINRNQIDLDAKAAELEKLNVALCQANSRLEISLSEVRLLNDDLERFASIASHDLKEPLRTIRSFLLLLQRKNEGKLDPESVEYLQFAVSGASRMTQLIFDLLEYARAGTSSFDLQPVVGATFLDVRFRQMIDHQRQRRQSPRQRGGVA